MKVFTLILVFFPLLAFSNSDDIKKLAKQSFHIEHPTCEIPIAPEHGLEGSIQSHFEKHLQERGYKVVYLKDKRVVPRSFYFSVDIKKEGLIFKDCIVTLSLRRAKNNLISKNDEDIHSRTVRREIPRVSFSGDILCKKAIQDVFVHIPFCLLPQR